MSTRFNTFNTTSGLATEHTQRQIKDKLNSTLDVNVVTLPGGGNNVNLVSVANTTLLSAHVPTNQEQINGNTISTNIGNTDTGTQRVIIASDQPEVRTNLTQLNGVTLDPSADPGTLPITLQASNTSVQTNNNLIGVNGSNLGLAASGPTLGATQRVTLANDQDTSSFGNFPTNLTQINGNSVLTNIGLSGLGAQRVTQVTDQQYFASASQPIIQKRNYQLSLHNDTYINITAANANQYKCFHPSSTIQQFYDATLKIFSPTLFIPTANTTAQVISSLPLADGLGLTGTLLYYTNASNPSLQSANITISTLGYVPANPGTTVPNFFRAIAWIPTGFPPGFQGNQGDITIVDDATGLLTYPGVVAISTNGWNSSLIYFPLITNSDFDGTRNIGRWLLDYSGYHLDNPAGNNTRIAVWLKDSTSANGWRQLIRFQVGSSSSGGLGYVPLQNINFSALAQRNDLMFSVSKEAGGASVFLSSAFGGHVE